MPGIEIASYNPTESNRKNFIANTAHYDIHFPTKVLHQAVKGF